MNKPIEKGDELYANDEEKQKKKKNRNKNEKHKTKFGGKISFSGI